MIVLDTHVWVWWVSESTPLSLQAREVIEEGMARRALYLSSISAWEVAFLVARGRLALTMEAEDWVARCEALTFVHFVPVDNRVALRANTLPEPLHKDPADRMIIATALSLGFPVVTRDEKLRDYPHVETIW